MRRTDFPPGFLFGVATAAYQIEGGTNEDGRGESIWDRFSRQPGAVVDGSTGDIACDHRHRWREDVDLMSSLGVPAYRFSIAWPRVLPAGRGQPSNKGLDFYRTLVDALLEAAITPAITLYHWDLPQALQDRGGWANPDVASWFRDYAAVVFDALGDRVPLWVTLNEPWCVATLGHLYGIHAPGIRDLRQTLAVCKHLLVAHGQAVGAFRDHGSTGKIGIALNMTAAYPASASSADRDAAERTEAFHDLLFSDPILKGEWPRVLVTALGDPPEWETTPAEWKAIQSPIDFLAINYYSRTVVRDDPTATPFRTTSVDLADRPRTAMGWEVHPEGIAEVLGMVTRRYGKLPLYVMENGAAFDDEPDATGFVEDTARAQFLEAHLVAGLRAIEAGADLRGWFVWSLLDNYEWAEGYKKRFGIVRVDYTTQERIPKASGRWFESLMREGAPGT